MRNYINEFVQVRATYFDLEDSGNANIWQLAADAVGYLLPDRSGATRT